VAKYDYGSSEANTARYGEAKAPAYNLSNIPKNLPLFLSYGALDTLSDVRDVNLLLGILKPNHDADKLTIQYINNYAHMDFIMGVNAKDVVYSQVLSFFKNHTGFWTGQLYNNICLRSFKFSRENHPYFLGNKRWAIAFKACCRPPWTWE